MSKDVAKLYEKWLELWQFLDSLRYEADEFLSLLPDDQPNDADVSITWEELGDEVTALRVVVANCRAVLDAHMPIWLRDEAQEQERRLAILDGELPEDDEPADEPVTVQPQRRGYEFL
jgi:hypothetical protein